MKKLKRSLKVLTSSGKWTCHYHGLSFWQSSAMPHLDCGDLIYDQNNNSNLSDIIGGAV